MIDITILTDARYVSPTSTDEYTQNVLLEDGLVEKELTKLGYKVYRTNWDNPDFDWSQTRYALFRTTWDYFDRYPEFSLWLKNTQHLTRFINSIDTIFWNLDKHYLGDLAKKDIAIPPTLFIEKGDKRSLKEIYEHSGWEETILKPVVGGAARHTYRVNASKTNEHNETFKRLIAEESMMLQEFQHQVLTKGELSLMVFNGTFSHAILKRAKPGDFRVQDDFGGTVHTHIATSSEIDFAEKAVSACTTKHVYARVDAIWNNNDELCLSELELIEPELWFRESTEAPKLFAKAVSNYLENGD